MAKYTRNNTHQWNWSEGYPTLEAIGQDLAETNLGIGWTDTVNDALYICKVGGHFILYVWNGGDSTLIREAIRDYFDLREVSK